MNADLNSNNCFYDDLDKNFELAYKMSELEFSHDELTSMLLNGNIPEKQIAALKFDYVKDENDAAALLNNLTGCDGKIREAVAQKIHSLLASSSDAKTIFSKLSAEKFADATIDINANICRLIVDSSALLKYDEQFAKAYINRIVFYTQQALDELDKFIFRDKKYVINKQIFKLYWCLEALCVFNNQVDDNTLKNILNKCVLQSEYTIREKVAQIISSTDKYDDLKQKLINDENYYVREALHHPSIL